MNSDSEYRVTLTLVPEFDGTKATAGELALLEACIPELVAALLDTIVNEE